MRKIADISFELTNPSAGEAETLFQRASDATEAWLASKGKLISSNETDNFRITKDKRIASLVRSEHSLDEGKQLHVTLREPVSEQTFETDIRISFADPSVAVTCELRVGAASPGAPIRYEPFSPRLVPQIIGLSDKWAIADTPVTTRAVAFSGASGGSDLAQVLWHPDRAIPVVVVSDHNGLLLAPGIHDALAQELSGVALVARTDTDASWQLTALRGAAWSCYNGALRMYYPRLDSSADPRRHPLWTQRLYDQTAEELDDSARRLRSLLRRLALSFSAFSTYEPRPLTQLRAALDKAQRKRPTSPPPADPGWEAVATSYADDNVRLQADNAKLRSEVDDLRVQLANLQSAIAWRERAQEGDPAPAGAVPPATVEQAVQTARAQYGDDLLFGRSVETGIAGVAPDSGPPEKILNYLGILAQLAQARRIGPLGQNMVTWVEGKGATCSGESETILNSKEECRRRTWDDGTGAPRFFEMHLKPSDATSPDRCVRIYFEYDEVRKKVLIGWLGRKPGL